jgi:hypothetical protein
MRELGVGGQMQKFNSPRQYQYGRRGEQEVIGKRDDGADCAGVGGWVVIIVTRGLLRLRVEGRSNGKVALNGRRRMRRGDPVEMPARQHKLDRERKKRQPRASFDVRPEPLHAYRRPASRGHEHPGLLM